MTLCIGYRTGSPGHRASVRDCPNPPAFPSFVSPSAPGSTIDGTEDAEGGLEGPQPGSPTAPNLLSVVRATETTVTVTCAFPAVVKFSRFVIEQKDEEGNWRFVAAPAVRTWTGTPIAMNAELPVRIVVYNTAGENAGSNGVTL